MRIVKDFNFRGIPYKISCIETFSQHPSWYSFEDEQTVRDAKWYIQPGEVIFDVGAAYGSYSLTALSQGANFIYAWSPQGEPGGPKEKDLFQESLELNNWQDKCIIYDFGFYSKNGWINALTQEFHENQPEEMTNDIIEVITIDSWYEDQPIVTDANYWMKIDVEGAEVHVLKGAEKLISDLRPKILVELHLFKNNNLEQEVRELLTSWNYKEIETTPYHSISHSLYHPE